MKAYSIEVNPNGIPQTKSPGLPAAATPGQETSATRSAEIQEPLGVKRTPRPKRRVVNPGQSDDCVERSINLGYEQAISQIVIHSRE